MSHAAIVAREYGLPGVVGLPDRDADDSRRRDACGSTPAKGEVTAAVMMAPLELRLAQDEAQLRRQVGATRRASLRDGLPVPPGWALSVDFVEALVVRRRRRPRCDARRIPGATSRSRSRCAPPAWARTRRSRASPGMHFTELNRIGVRRHRRRDPRRSGIPGHSAGARAYRAKLGITGTPRIAVTLQKMVFPDCAGVMFTRHPVTGADEYRHRGLVGPGRGDRRGAGHSRPLPPSKGRHADRRSAPGTKDIVIQALPGGGDRGNDDRRSTAGQSGYCVERCATRRIWCALGARCERHFGPGRDIEWGIAGRRRCTCCSAAPSP